jgi:hypothetical protein
MEYIYTAKGDQYGTTLSGILLLASDTAHGSPIQTTIIGRVNAADFIKHILSVAIVAGYQHGDLLMTLLQWNLQSGRVRTMVQEICDLVGDEVFESALSSCKDDITMQMISTLFDRPLTSVQPIQGRFKKR